MLMNAKMPTIVGILTFMSLIKFMLSWVEYIKCFITLRPGACSHASKDLNRSLICLFYKIVFDTETQVEENDSLKL